MAELIEKDLVYRIVGAAMKVVRDIGHGFREKSYERALCVEFSRQGIAVDSQRTYPLLYEGVQIDEFIPDMVIDGRVIVDPKVIDRITDHERGQMLNYLRATGIKVAVLLNFRRPTLEWERIVLDQAR